MKFKYYFVGFSWDFNFKENDFSKYLHDFELAVDLCHADFVFIGSFITEQQYHFICCLNFIKILYITEPIEFTCPFSYKLYCEKKYDYLMGCVVDDLEKNCFAHPFFTHYPKFSNILFMDQVNESVRKCDLVSLTQKRFCALVNRHDNGETRTHVYKKMQSFNKVECPSQLFNNCSSEEIDELFNVDYYKLFQFNICPENYITSIPGYITEKLWYTCLAGAIPIYCGYFEENEEKIFNKERILFYNPRDEESLERVRQKVDFLLKNPEEFLKFYNQPVFCDTAYETIQKYNLNMYYMLKSVCKRLEAGK